VLTDTRSVEANQDFIRQLMASDAIAKRLKLEPIEPRLETNPFISRLQLDARKKRSGTTEVSVITDSDTGARIGFQQEDISYVDNGRFVKIMDCMLAAAFNLDGAGQKFFWLVLEQVQESPGKDEIYLSWAQEVTIGGGKATLTRRSFYRGVKSLKDAEFILPSYRGKGWFWINPTYFFNGDRVRFVNTYVRENPDLPEAKRPRVRYPEDKRPREKVREQIGHPQR
jgi:hypothetical protein